MFPSGCQCEEFSQCLPNRYRAVIGSGCVLTPGWVPDVALLAQSEGPAAGKRTLGCFKWSVQVAPQGQVGICTYFCGWMIGVQRVLNTCRCTGTPVTGQCPSQLGRTSHDI